MFTSPSVTPPRHRRMRCSQYSTRSSRTSTASSRARPRAASFRRRSSGSRRATRVERAACSHQALVADRAASSSDFTRSVIGPPRVAGQEDRHQLHRCSQALEAPPTQGPAGVDEALRAGKLSGAQLASWPTQPRRRTRPPAGLGPARRLQGFKDRCARPGPPVAPTRRRRPATRESARSASTGPGPMAPAPTAMRA